jgi:hypothetical protein
MLKIWENKMYNYFSNFIPHMLTKPHPAFNLQQLQSLNYATDQSYGK